MFNYLIDMLAAIVVVAALILFGILGPCTNYQPRHYPPQHHVTRHDTRGGR